MLADHIAPSRGDVIAATDAPPAVADHVEATVIWMADEPLLRGRTYLLRTGTKTVAATVAPIKYKLNVLSLEHVAATQLELNEIGICELQLEGLLERGMRAVSRNGIIGNPVGASAEIGEAVLDALTEALVEMVGG